MVASWKIRPTKRSLRREVAWETVNGPRALLREHSRRRCMPDADFAQPGQPHIRLVARDGKRLDVENVPASGAPERPLHVSFRGIYRRGATCGARGFPGRPAVYPGTGS